MISQSEEFGGNVAWSIADGLLFFFLILKWISQDLYKEKGCKSTVCLSPRVVLIELPLCYY